MACSRCILRETVARSTVSCAVGHPVSGPSAKPNGHYSQGRRVVLKAVYEVREARSNGVG
jgi:hypothetical protein